MSNELLTFKISTGLKNIIGKDLISDKYIAVFELVKNSYDAGATKVKISFTENAVGEPQLRIEDNGCGMDYESITNKWLFVAYSAKKKQNRQSTSFRDKIKREMAGAKGVGRFSCDRLGETLTLITKVVHEAFAHEVKICWNSFEINDKDEFANIPVEYAMLDDSPFNSPSGTTLIVDNFREGWDRESLLRLKRSLMKLISPDVDNNELPFEIEIYAPTEQTGDCNAKETKAPERNIVNGIVRNDILEKLDIKTTRIDVQIPQDGKTIVSTLTDRGEYIFSLTERNTKFSLLSGIHISLFYLNRSAKNSFKRQMGVESVNYGSIFIYKNGFRVYPYGEYGEDFFGVNKRKLQGQKRYLGTRELMGRISIRGETPGFVETSSRAHGFISTPESDMLPDFFMEKALRVLEKYVVNVISWGQPLKSNPDITIQPSDIGEAVIAQFFRGLKQENIIQYEYNRELLAQQVAQPNTITASLKKFEQAATDAGESELAELAHAVSRGTKTILSQNMEFEQDIGEKEQALEKSKRESLVREQQVHFLKSAANQDVKTLLNGMHSIYTFTEIVNSSLEDLRQALDQINFNQQQRDDIYNMLADSIKANQKANKLAELTMNGGEISYGCYDVHDFISQYLSSGLGGMIFDIFPVSFSCACEFNPKSLGIIIDNIVSNSSKHNADKLEISFSQTDSSIVLSFTDNGTGLQPNLESKLLFEWGVSGSAKGNGFGIGLNHVKELIEEMNGCIKIDENYIKGFRLVVSLRK